MNIDTLIVFDFDNSYYNQSNDKKNGWFTDAVSKDGSLMSFEQYSSSVLRLYIKDRDQPCFIANSNH